MPEKRRSYQARLSALRKEMKKEKRDGYILPRTDEFQSEFLAPYAERLKWLTGFTGSAGVSIVLDYKAVVMSDGRYTIQLKDQVDTKLFETDDMMKTSIGDWLAENAEFGTVIGYDVWLMTIDQVAKIKEKVAHKNIALKPTEGNLIDRIWVDHPQWPSKKATVFPDDIAGRTSREKRKSISKELKAKGCSACLVTQGDSIAWVLNIRGADVPYTPVCLSYLLLHEDGSAEWFVDGDKLTPDVARALGHTVKVHNFYNLEKRLSEVNGKLWIDPKTAPSWFGMIAQKNKIDVYEAEDPCVKPKSIKTIEEQKASRFVHILDGVAVTRFLKWVDDHQNKISKSELAAEGALDGFRRASDKYIGPSFETIAGFADHGAIVHYRATMQSNKIIKGDGLLLVDSGAQYKWGTTDITRTVAIGTPTEEMRENYTRVLKGHIAVASAVFESDTTGKEIDALARAPLRKEGLDYAHGTGHGVGCYLGVHEKATHISPKEDNTFEVGMLLSNEPGYYKEGEYGIRIENLVLVRDAQKSGCYRFDTISFAPFDPSLIVDSLLTKSEKEWLKTYEQNIADFIMPRLSQEEQAWLKTKLTFIETR